MSSALRLRVAACVACLAFLLVCKSVVLLLASLLLWDGRAAGRNLLFWRHLGFWDLVRVPRGKIRVVFSVS